MSLFTKKFLSATIMIGSEINATERTCKWFATGFAVSYLDRTLHRCYSLITSKSAIYGKHALTLSFSDPFLRISSEETLLLYHHNTPLAIRHPDPDIDLVSIPLAEEPVSGAIDIMNEALTLGQMQESGISEGNLVYTIGSPTVDHPDIQSPLCHLGCVSRITDAYFQPDASATYLISMPFIPHVPSAPVICRPEYACRNGISGSACARLIGVLTGYLPSNKPGTDGTHSGIGIVLPVDRIREVLTIDSDLHAARLMPHAPGAGDFCSGRSVLN